VIPGPRLPRGPVRAATSGDSTNPARGETSPARGATPGDATLPVLPGALPAIAVLPVSALLLLAAACAPGGGPSPADSAGAPGAGGPGSAPASGPRGEPPPAVEAELRRVAGEEINRSFAANRVEALAPHLASEVTAFGPADRRLVHGGETMLEGLRRAASAKTTHRWEESDWHAQLYGDVGVVTFLYEHDATRDGRRSTSRNRATYVFHRRDGRWLLVHDHTSAVP